jgi:Ala-tRNA(Pro) deacylase
MTGGMKTRADPMALLRRLGVAHSTHEHPAVFRVGEGERIKAAIPGAHQEPVPEGRQGQLG